MAKKSSAEYQREYRKRLREQGLVKKEVWIRPEQSRQLAAFEKNLRVHEGNSKYSSALMGGKYMSDTANKWTTESLFEALKERPAFNNDSCSIEIVDGLDSSIVISMHNYGDLPIFLTVGGEQLLAETVLFSVNDVSDTAVFNEYVLKTHKYLPLSTISIESDESHGDYYCIFGALNASSNLNDIVLEIEMLADNTIQATEALMHFLKS